MRSRLPWDPWLELLSRDQWQAQFRTKSQYETEAAAQWGGDQRLDDLRAQPTAGDSRDHTLSSGTSRLPALSWFRGVYLF